MKRGVTSNSSNSGETEQELVFRAGTYVSKRGRLQQEVNKYFAEKDLIAREIQVFEVNPPKLGGAELNQIVGSLRDLLRRRNVLYEKECRTIEDLANLERQIDRLKFAEPGRIKDSARSNLQDMLASVVEDVQFIDLEKSSIMKEFKGLRTFDSSSAPENGYGALQTEAGMAGGRVPSVGTAPDGPGLAIDAMRIAEFLNTNYDKLQKSNPRLVLELENIVKYLQGGDFRREYKPAQVQEELDKVVAKRLAGEKEREREKEARKEEGQLEAAGVLLKWKGD